MDDIVTMLEEILNGCRKIPEEERNRFQTAKELIGKCPVCGSDIFEGKRNFTARTASVILLFGRITDF